MRDQMTTEEIPPPDILTDRIAVIAGATLVGAYPAMFAIPDDASAWVTKVPIEREPGEPEACWPRETHFRVCHEFQVGTVAELADDYREKLTCAFLSYTIPPGCNIPSTGEPSLRKQTALFERHGITGLTTIKPDPGALQAREDRRIARTGRPLRQDALTRDRLKRLVGSWRGECHAPTDSPEAVNSLIEALTILRDDHDAASPAVPAAV